MSNLVAIVEGWTQEIGPFILMGDGVAVDLTGLIVTVILRDENRNPKTFAGSLRVDADPTSGKVYITPVAADFVAGKYPYHVHFKVVDDDLKAVFFPSGQPDEIAVWPA